MPASIAIGYNGSHMKNTRIAALGCAFVITMLASPASSSDWVISSQTPSIIFQAHLSSTARQRCATAGRRSRRRADRSGRPTKGTGAMLTEHLLQLGHRKIAFIAGPKHMHTASERHIAALLAPQRKCMGVWQPTSR